MLIKNILTFLIIFIPYKAVAMQEKDYINTHCKGHIEYRIKGERTRVDCLLEEKACEYDFSNKYHQCIGQALYYGFATNKRPCCVLIENSKSSFKHIIKARSIIQYYNLPVELYVIKRDKLE